MRDMTTCTRWSSALCSHLSCKAESCLPACSVVRASSHLKKPYFPDNRPVFCCGPSPLVLFKPELSSVSRKTSKIVWASQMATEEILIGRSLRDDTDDPMVTECSAEPTSDLSIPDFRGGVVALGKFDALHTGHRALAEQASTMGSPILLSFSGMADVLGWMPRLPIAAFCDRKRVMATWAGFCGGVAPVEYCLEFSKVRKLSPREFVHKLSADLHVKGVVAGANYRFGYKAAGDASDLVQLCNEYGMESFIVHSVMDKNDISGSMNGELSGNSREKGQVSSTRVRKALAMGDMERVADLLGRKHRLVLKLDNSTTESGKLIIPVRSALNQYPGEGQYTCDIIQTGGYVNNFPPGPDHNLQPDDVLIESSQVTIGPAWIEIALADNVIQVARQRKLLGLEF